MWNFDDPKEFVLIHHSQQHACMHLKYVQLEQALFDKDADSFTCKVARTSEEIKQLIEAGFDYVTEKDSLIYFRKRK